MNQISPKKLMHSKWTAQPLVKEAMQLRKKEKHFSIVKVEFDDQKNVVDCQIEAILTRRCFSIDWKNLKNSELWKQGWC